MTEMKKTPEQLKLEWNYDPALRAEFMDDFELYLAYKKDDGSVKIKLAPSVAVKERF